jgi:uncharacterized membrane protein
MRIQVYLVSFLTLAASLASSTAPASEFVTIGPGTFAGPVSGDGSVVIATGGYWTRDHGLVPLPGATAVSDDASAIIGNAESGPYRWTAATGTESIAYPPTGEITGVGSISGDGRVIGGSSAGESGAAFIWTAEDGYRWLGADARYVKAISADGRVVVGTGVDGGEFNPPRAFRWTQETGVVRLPTLGGGIFISDAFDLSADGSVVVGYTPSSRMPNGNLEAFRWTAEGGMKGLGALPGATSSQAYGVSADGLVAVGGSRVGSFNAVVWDEVHGMRRLENVLREEYGLTQLPPGRLGSARRISADRRTIVGITNEPFETWVAYLDHPIGPPLPEFGDYNADGKVSQPDLNLALGKWGQDLPDFAYPWINDLPVGVVGQGELNAVVLNWPPTAGPLDLSLASAPGALTANIDLKNNAAIINYTGTSPVATVSQQILSGRGGAGLGKPWNGQGITSSTAANANATDAESRSVGYAENGAMPLGPYTIFRGQPVDNTSMLIAFTRTGDANLDGVVNDDDVTIVGASYAPGVPQPSWAHGDFDYNGFVDDDDVTLLGAFYDPSAAPLVAPAAVTSPVPEPNSLILLLTAGATALLAAIRYRGRSHP